MLASPKQKNLPRDLGLAGSIAGPMTVLPWAGCPSEGSLLQQPQQLGAVQCSELTWTAEMCAHSGSSELLSLCS